MRLFDASAGAALLTCMAGAASGQTVAGQSGTPALHPPDDQIVVTGRRDGEKYRLPTQFRPVKEDPADRSRRALARDWLCHNVGPRGCPMKLNPLITAGSGGSVRFGEPGGGK